MGTNKGDNTNNADKEEIISKNRFINGYMIVILMSSEQRARSSEFGVRSREFGATSLTLRSKSYELRAYPSELTPPN